MTNYGTIPTSSHPPIDLESISKVKHRIKSGLSTRRPWRSMFDLDSFKFPKGIIESFSRIKTNLIFYRANYAIVFLSILFLSLIYHPTSLIVLAVLIVLWIFLYFLRDEALKIYGHQINDRTVLIGLLVLTIGLLLLTGATGNIVWSLVVAVGLVLVHSVFRRSDNLVLDDEVVAVSEVSGLTSSPSS